LVEIADAPSPPSLQSGTGRVTEIYLFTFADLSSLQAGVAEIKQVCRRER
jgi:hypothetical protein